MNKICHPKFLDIIVIVKEWYFWLFFSHSKNDANCVPIGSAKKGLNQHSYTQLAKFIKIWQFDKEFGKFDFTFTQVDDIAAVADLEQQHPDWKEFLRN